MLPIACVILHLPVVSYSVRGLVFGLVVAIVVESHSSLNLTSAMCTHSIVPDTLLISMK